MARMMWAFDQIGCILDKIIITSIWCTYKN